MSVQTSAAVTAAPSDTPNVHTPACCGRPDCAGTTACYREFAASETGWRVIANRRPNWVLANGQAV